MLLVSLVLALILILLKKKEITTKENTLEYCIIIQVNFVCNPSVTLAGLFPATLKGAQCLWCYISAFLSIKDARVFMVFEIQNRLYITRSL